MLYLLPFPGVKKCTPGASLLINIKEQNKFIFDKSALLNSKQQTLSKLNENLYRWMFCLAQNNSVPEAATVQ